VADYTRFFRFTIRSLEVNIWIENRLLKL